MLIPIQAILFFLDYQCRRRLSRVSGGNKVAEKVPLDLSWVSGLLLMVLAFLKLT